MQAENRNLEAGRSRGVIILMVATLLLCVGCKDRGEDVGDPEPAIAECLWDEESVGWDDEAPNGLVPRDVMAEVEGDYEVVGGVVDHDGDETYEIRFERRGDNAVHMTDIQGGCSGDRLELPATLMVATEDGRLDETFDVDAWTISGEAVEVSHRFEVAQLQGHWEPIPPEDHELLDLSVEATFADESVTGRVLLRWEFMDDEVASSGTERVFFW